MINDFDKNGYVYLKNFLDLNNCRELTQELNNYIERGETTKDPQCPLSESIHGTVTFDKLLQDLLPHFEKACGKRLYPTYSYARLYKPGEKLKKHKDRPACEISATITLGFEGDVWSIYMAGNKIDMQVGDAVLYRGMEVEHWREKYTEGQWQAQVFLHYVDADGPHADQKYDGRESLGLPKTDCLPMWISYSNHISEKFCDMVVNRYSQDDIKKLKPYIGEGEISTIDTTIRDVERVWLPLHTGFAATLTATGLNANYSSWKYIITHSDQAEFLIYKPEGHYQPHVDTFHKHADNIRKLTVVAFLTDDYEGGKFYIQTSHEKHYPSQNKGTVIVFPSYIMHGVEPVTKGIRYSAVNWLLGPYFK